MFLRQGLHGTPAIYTKNITGPVHRIIPCGPEAQCRRGLPSRLSGRNPCFSDKLLVVWAVVLGIASSGWSGAVECFSETLTLHGNPRVITPTSHPMRKFARASSENALRAEVLRCESRLLRQWAEVEDEIVQYSIDAADERDVGIAFHEEFGTPLDRAGIGFDEQAIRVLEEGLKASQTNMALSPRLAIQRYLAAGGLKLKPSASEKVSSQLGRRSTLVVAEYLRDRLRRCAISTSLLVSTRRKLEAMNHERIKQIERKYHMKMGRYEDQSLPRGGYPYLSELERARAGGG